MNKDSTKRSSFKSKATGSVSSKTKETLSSSRDVKSRSASKEKVCFSNLRRIV